MRVGDLLALDSLGLKLLWGGPELLARAVEGLTATDLADPRRFLQQGELVLSGLVWWKPDSAQDGADRFVAALREADAAALLAGEETHGGVPDEVLRACRRYGVALLAVPKQTSFRAITDAVYLRRWRELAGDSLPGGLRQALRQQIAEGAAAADVLDRVSAHLGGLPCVLATASGRPIARSGGASTPIAGGPRHPVGPTGSAYDTWFLHVPDVPPGTLRELSELLAPYRHRAAQREAASQEAATVVLAALPEAVPGPRDLQACGLSEGGPYTLVAMPGFLRGALREALVLATGEEAIAVGVCGEQAVALVDGTAGAAGTTKATEIAGPIGTTGATGLAARLRPVLECLTSCDPLVPLRAGTSASVAKPELLDHGLAQARQALAVAIELGRTVTATEEIASLPALLAGLPAPVRAAYRDQVLGELLRDNAADLALLKTLRAFLACDGSWIRTAESLHVHVNTVHYRVQRIEKLTGRDLSRLDDRLDLYAALQCRPDEGA